ncbi:prefoldin domain-containing protein [Promicromonospora sp. NPDC023805]|uniref:prefoldin domain-containing protein n=1 Tax=Promicromonospora sp. NPDC023805 TaxID=3154696 RepID=UPI0033D1C86A
MSDDERARPAAELNPTPEPDPAPAAPEGDLPAGAEPAPAPEPPPVSAPAPAPAPASELKPEPAPTSEPAPPKAPNKAVAFVRANVAVIVLAVLLVGAVVWGALGTVSAGDWESRATSLSAELTSAEKSLADAEATIDDLETAKSRAESTATACIGAIGDADAMLEVSAKLDDKTVTYMDGLNDFMAAINARDIAAVETIGAEMDKLTVQIDDLSKEIEKHIEAYGDSAEGCHVDDAQDV